MEIKVEVGTEPLHDTFFTRVPITHKYVRKPVLTITLEDWGPKDGGEEVTIWLDFEENVTFTRKDLPNVIKALQMLAEQKFEARDDG